jgi:serine/threonine-protein kinase
VKICPACSREYGDEHEACRDDGVVLVRLDTGSSERAQDLIGKVVDGRYRVERIVGRGGMGTVYACRHVVVGKPFAMKVLRPGIERSEEILQRFIREAQAANAVQSRHICEMTDFGQLSNGAFYVVMELLDGMSLTRALRESLLNRKNLKHIFIQIAETLHRAHKASIIHRDLKPDNVVLVNDEGDPHFVKLVDFGIAKMVQSKASNLTETGVILGTPYYMSPEQARGDELDHRSDIYALGVMMYRAFTGRLPFVADTAMGVLTRHLTEKPELPSRLAEIDPALERLILRCLEKKAIDRFQTMADVSTALRAVSDEARHQPLRATIDERTGPAPAALPVLPSLHNEEHPTPTRVATPMAKSLRKHAQDNRAQAASAPVKRSNPPPRPRSNPPPGMPVLPGPMPLPQVPASQRPRPPQGPSAQGPSAQGPSAQGPSAQGPSAQAPSALAPGAQPPGAQAPSALAPSAQGSARPVEPSRDLATPHGAQAIAKRQHPTPEHGVLTPGPLAASGGWSSGSHPAPSGVHRVHEPIAPTPPPRPFAPPMGPLPLPPQVPTGMTPGLGAPADGLPHYLVGEAATHRGVSARISVRPQLGSRRLAVVGGVLVGLVFALGALAVGLYAFRTAGPASAGSAGDSDAPSPPSAERPAPSASDAAPPEPSADDTAEPDPTSSTPAGASAEPSARDRPPGGKRKQQPPTAPGNDGQPDEDPVDDVRNPFD